MNWLIILILIINLLVLFLTLYSQKREKYISGVFDWSKKKLEESAREVTGSIKDITKGLEILGISPKGQNLGCPANEFIKTLYSILIKYGVCFLQGAFVLSDEGGKLFELFTKACNFNYRTGFTHDIFMNIQKFKRDIVDNLPEQELEKIDVSLDQKVLELNKGNLGNPIQYELPLNPYLSFLCDPMCNNQSSSSNDNCLENKRSEKQIILFYPFKINITNKIDGSIIFSKRYLYMKLESNPALSPEHAVGAFKAYLLKQDDSKSQYPIRRERKTKEDEKEQAIQFQFIDENLLKDYKFLETDYKFYSNFSPNSMGEFIQYSKYFRSFNEFFVSQELVNMILNQMESERLQRREKREKEMKENEI